MIRPSHLRCIQAGTRKSAWTYPTLETIVQRYFTYSKWTKLILNTRWRWRYCCTKKNIVHVLAISGGVGYFSPFFFFLCSKRVACWLNQRTFSTLLGELNFDLCESGLQRLTEVELSNEASSNINLQNWNSFLRCMHFFLMPTIKLIENYIAVATTLI